MRTFLKMTGLVAVIIVGLLSASCGDVSGDPTALTGTWTITPTNSGTTDVGTTVMTLTYLGEILVDIWIGTCTVTGGDIPGIWSAGGASGFGQNSVSIVSDTDSDLDGYEDQIDFTITSGLGSTMSGTFEGESSGPWSNISGTFTMVKQ